MNSELSDFAPSATAAMLQLRARLLRQIRDFFHERGFLEVDTPVLSADTVVDRHLDPLKVVVYDDPREPDRGATFWLQTSPEFAMKRLVAAHRQSIYQITRAFRAGETGRLHNPEFTMLEWYDVGADYQSAQRFLSDFAREILGRCAAEFLAYRDAFQAHAGVDPFTASIEELERVALAQGLIESGSFSTDRDGWLELILTQCVEPQLGRVAPTILYDYPPSQAALARVRDEGERQVAERFELYVEGVELANGYHELLDAGALRRRAHLANRQRIADGKRPLPVDSRLASAMEHGLPACAGVALGFDRLVMLVSGAPSLSAVLPFPIDRA